MPSIPDLDSFSTLKILATVKQCEENWEVDSGFSTLKILATVKRCIVIHQELLCFSTLKILATVKLDPKYFKYLYVLVPLRF